MLWIADCWPIATLYYGRKSWWRLSSQAVKKGVMSSRHAHFMILEMVRIILMVHELDLPRIQSMVTRSDGRTVSPWLAAQKFPPRFLHWLIRCLQDTSKLSNSCLLSSFPKLFAWSSSLASHHMWRLPHFMHHHTRNYKGSKTRRNNEGMFDKNHWVG